MVRSEQRKQEGAETFAKMQEQLKELSPEVLRAFIDSQDPDKMGFDGTEGIDDGADN